MTQTSRKSIRWKTLLIIAGAHISYSIGAGFGSGVELMQYFGVHGATGYVGLAITATMAIALTFVVAHDCRQYHLPDMNAMYQHYCGKYLGTLMRWYAVIIIFSISGGMISGGAETLNSMFHIDLRVGAILMLIVTALTSAMGLKKLMDILGRIAPMILAAVLIICVSSYLMPADSFSEGSQILQNDTSALRISNSILFTAILNFSYATLGAGSYVSSVAVRTDLTNGEVITGNTMGQVMIQLFNALILLAFILNGSAVTGSEIPLLDLSARLGHGFSLFYGIILLLAIYTTATGMSWVVASNVQKESSKWYKPVAVLVCVGAYVLSLVGSFAELMNKIMSISSYVGLLYVVCIIVSKVYRAIRKKPVPERVGEKNGG